MHAIRRRGLSLAEVLLFTGLAILVGSFAVHIYTRSTIVTDETQKAILVQQDIRAIVEYVSRDMNAALMVWDTGSDREHSIRLVKFATENTANRIQYNVVSANRRDYPFARPDQAVENRLDAYLVTYTFSAADQVVRRHEEKGVFVQRTAAVRGMATEFAWDKETTTMDQRVLGGINTISSDPETRTFFRAPALIILLKDVRGIGSPDLDLGICGQTMDLAAHSLGLGTCWVSLIKGATFKKKFREGVLGVKYPFQIVSSLTLGYPAGQIDTIVRREQPRVKWIE